MTLTCHNSRADKIDTKTNPLHRPGRQLRQEAETMLRDMAYVLQLTGQIKEQILREQEECATVIAAQPE
jgi:hypothetical protein